MPRKRTVWRGSISIKQADGTLVRVLEVEDITGVLGEPNVTHLLSQEEEQVHLDKITKRVAEVAAELKDSNGNYLLPDGTYNIMDLLRG